MSDEQPEQEAAAAQAEAPEPDQREPEAQQHWSEGEPAAAGEPSEGQDPAAESADAESQDAAAGGREAELLGDLLRVQAEYANYRKRVDRDRDLIRELAVAESVSALLPVLDDLDRAESHGDIPEGPIQLITQKLRAAVNKLGLEAFGAQGDAFDPERFEAIAHVPTDTVAENHVLDVVQTGYLLGDRVVRVAKVAVAAAAPAAQPAAGE